MMARTTTSLTPLAPPETALRRGAKALRALAMVADDGELLGSEEELITRFGVSRPTLRLAAAQVAQEHLITIKRGVNGGYFARVPGSKPVSRVAALYLRRHGAKLGDIIEAIQPLRDALIRLAAHKASTRKQVLRDFIDEDSHTGEIDYRYFLRSERQFANMLSEISGNRVLGLFLNIVYDVAEQLRQQEEIYVTEPERADQYRLHRSRMAAAVLEGDAEMAALASSRCAEIVKVWRNNNGEVSDFQTLAIDVGDELAGRERKKRRG
jgi:GntR family transcriptional repressor for pyruvate dehydrogenase complex